MELQRKQELDENYRKAVVGQSQEKTQHEWLKYLAILYEEDNNYQIFLDLRSKARNQGAKIATRYLMKVITIKEFFTQGQIVCGDTYANDLNRYGIANINLKSDEYLTITRETIMESLQAFKDVGTDKIKICRAMAIIWHRYVERLHKEFNLPSVSDLSDTIHWSSDTEKEVIESNDFETSLTEKEKADWEKLIK